MMEFAIMFGVVGFVVVFALLCGWANGDFDPAQVDTLPKGRDAKQGSVGTKGSAVAEGHAPNPSTPSHIPLMNKDER